MTVETTVPTDSGRCPVAPGLELSWQTRGSGPALIMLNNFFMDANHWRNATNRLVRNHRVVTYDLRNQGESGRAGGSHWVDHVTDLAALVDHLGLDRPHLLGTSDSCLLARDYALARPDRVGGLILVGPTISPIGEERLGRITQTWIDALDELGPAAFFELAYPMTFGDKLTEDLGELGFKARLMAFLAHCDPAELKHGMELVLEAHLGPDGLEDLLAPTMVMVGDDDFTIGVTAARQLAGLLPDGRTVVMEGSGHLPYIDATERFEAEVADFVAKAEKTLNRP